jgi:S-layer homology domain
MRRGSSGWFGTVGALCGVLALVVSVGGVALGSNADLFSDIATSPFRLQINRIGRAGCASGFPDGTFHPRDTVNRQQFAFWTNNCDGRAAWDSNQVPQMAPIPTDVVDVDLVGGGTPSAVAEGGFAFVTGNLVATVSSGNTGQCPCRVTAQLDDGTTPHGHPGEATLGGTADESGELTVSIPVSTVFRISPGQQMTFRLIAQYEDSNLSSISYTGDITAVYVPFGAEGDQGLDANPD